MPGTDPLAPARRGGAMLMVLGVLSAGCSAYHGIQAVTAPFEKLVAQMGGKLPETPPGISTEQLVRAAYVLAAVLVLGFALLLFLIGFFARRGGRRSVITGIVLGFILLFWSALNMLGGILSIVVTPGTIPWGQLAYAAVICGVSIVTLICLFQALGASRGLAWQQRPAQFWAMQQQQSPGPQPGYGYGYGYGYGAPPGTPAAPPPQQSLGPMPPPPGTSNPEPTEGERKDPG